MTALPASGITTTIDPHHDRQLTFQGYTVLLTNADGTITEGDGLGLFDYDTRVLSKYLLLIDGAVPRCDTSANVESDYWITHLAITRPGGNPAGPRLPQDAVAIEIRRRVGCGMAEQILIRNHSMTDVHVRMRLEFAADFADVSEKDGAPSHHGRTTSSWNEAARALTFEHRAAHGDEQLHRATRIRFVRSDSEAKGESDAVSFLIRLGPGGVWTAILAFDSLVDERWRMPQVDVATNTNRDRIREAWRNARTRIDAVHPVLAPAVNQAIEDLFALRAWELEDAAEGWVVNAGMPTYTGLFGRDSLTTAWQAAILDPEILRGTLARIAATQATDD